MNFFTILFAAILVSQYCHAAPQRGGDPENEVELVPATNTNTRDPESRFPFLGSGGTRDNGFPVIIVRTSSGGRNPLHTLLKDLFGKSGSTDEEETVGDSGLIPEIPLSDLPDLSTILGIQNKGGNGGDVVSNDGFFPSFPSIFKQPTSDDDDKKNCGLLCTLFKRFDTQLKQIEEEVREIRDNEREKENEISQGNDEDNNGPVNEYTEEVLPDGTIVRTNKTYTTSEDGSSFYSFQSTSFNTFGHNTDSKIEVQTEDKNGQVDDVNVLDEKTVSDNSEDNSSPEDIDEEREELEENIPLITVQENKRTARSPNDPFDQQQQDVSVFLLEKKPFKQQQQDILSLLNPQDNEISNDPLRRRTERIPVYQPLSLHGDTLVNDLLLNNGRRGGLIRLEPDAEFLDKDTQQQQE